MGSRVGLVGIKEGRTLGPLGVILGRFEGIIVDGFTVDLTVGRREVGFAVGFCVDVIDVVSEKFRINNMEVVTLNNRAYFRDKTRCKIEFFFCGNLI